MAEGVFYPDEGGDETDNNRDTTFQLIDGVEIYGGFDPNANDDEFSDRDWAANPTILSGDIDGKDTTTDGVVTDTDDIDGDNSYHVATGDEMAGDVSLGTLSADVHLIANPFISDINFDEITDGTDPLDIAGSVWDPNAGEEGSYVLTPRWTWIINFPSGREPILSLPVKQRL